MPNDAVVPVDTITPPALASGAKMPDRPTSQTDPWRVTRGQGPVSLVTSTRPSPSDRGTLTRALLGLWIFHDLLGGGGGV